jgi:hypothetical protein
VSRLTTLLEDYLDEYNLSSTNALNLGGWSTPVLRLGAQVTVIHLAGGMYHELMCPQLLRNEDCILASHVTLTSDCARIQCLSCQQL